MYWVHWNTRNAKLARKSLAESRPATGRSWKPVRSVCVCVCVCVQEAGERDIEIG